LQRNGLKPRASILEVSDLYGWQEAERWWIHYMREFMKQRLINRVDGGIGAAGLVYTPAMRKKISEANKGHKHSDETKQKISAAKTGKKFPPLSEEQKEKIRQTHKLRGVRPRLTPEQRRRAVENRRGFRHTEEHKRYMSELNKGKVLSLEHRKKISEALKGRKRELFTEEHRRKLGEASRGRKFTEESKRKIGEKSRGRKHTEETRQKISEKVKENYRMGGGRKIWGGKKHTEEHKRKISESLKAHHHNSRNIQDEVEPCESYS